MKKVCVLPTLLAIVTIALAPCAIAQTSGNQSFTVFAVGPPGTPRTVVAVGVMNGVGTVVHGPAGRNQANPTWVFPGGSLSVHLNYVSENTSITWRASSPRTRSGRGASLPVQERSPVPLVAEPSQGQIHESSTSLRTGVTGPRPNSLSSSTTERSPCPGALETYTPQPAQETSNSLPSGSTSSVHRPSWPSWTPTTVAPRPRRRSTSASSSFGPTRRAR